MSPQRIRNIVLPLCAVLLAASCSTTRRLGSDEVLYTGVKKILIEPDSGVVLTPAAESAVKEPLSVAPNNPALQPLPPHPAARRAVGTTTSIRRRRKDSNTGSTSGWPNSRC